MKFKYPLILSILLITLLYSCTKPKPVIEILTRINHDLKQSEIDLYMDSVGYKWFNDSEDGKLYIPKSKKDSDAFILKGTDKYGIASTYRTNDLNSYLSIIEKAKIDGFTEVDTSELDLSSIGIYGLKLGEDRIIYQKTNENGKVYYDIRLHTPKK